MTTNTLGFNFNAFLGDKVICRKWMKAKLLCLSYFHFYERQSSLVLMERRLSPFTLMEPPMFALKAPLWQVISAFQTG